MENVRFDPISPALGAFVRVSADRILSDGVPGQIKDALEHYGVIVFPQLNLSDEKFVSLTKCLGTMEAAKATADGSGPSQLGIYRISLDKADKSQREYVEGNDFWHMDGTSYSTPGKATLLKCENPPATGGDTEFAHLFAAYDTLPTQEKQELATLRIVHCLEAVGHKMKPNPDPNDIERWNKIFPPREHPLVWKQKSGKTSLVIGSTAKHIVGMPKEASDKLLNKLLSWCTQPFFTYRHHWKKGDLVIWNNPGMLHRSHPYDASSGRVMHRTTLKGVEAIE